MSQDLLSAFGSPLPPERKPISQHEWNSLSSDLGPAANFEEMASTYVVVPSPQDTAVNELENEDDFGEFEDASALPTPQPFAQQAPVASPVMTRELPKPTYPPPKKTTTSLLDSRDVSKGASTNKPTYPPPKKVKLPPIEQRAATRPEKDAPELGRHPFAGRMDLLFEADGDEYDAGVDEIGDISTNPEAAMAYSKRIIAEQESNKQNQMLPKTGIGKRRELDQSGRDGRREDILFDADTDQPDDDFGDFEGGSEVRDGVPNVDVLSLNDKPPERPKSQRTNTPIRPVTELERTLHRQKVLAGRSSSMPANGDDEAWDDFEDSTSPPATISPSALAPIDLLPNTPFQRSTTALTSKPSTTTTLPPTNIPPPAILLSIFPSIFTSGDESLFTPLSRLQHKDRQTLLSHPATHQFLKGYLALITVLGHIIAGRKYRWKRDQYLSQGMRIGAANGKSGMKLTGVDRSEIAKEDREVLDVFRLWKGQVGKLRSAVVGASASMKGEKLPPVPDLAEQMAIKLLKGAEGGVTAAHACALCGLKRDERIMKVDYDVEDSFGEWWVEGMNMHLLCRNFWGEYEAKLRSR